MGGGKLSNLKFTFVKQLTLLKIYTILGHSNNWVGLLIGDAGFISAGEET